MENLKEYLISPNIKSFNRFNPKLKIAILASGEGSNFQNLINYSKEGLLDIEITKLITNNEKAACIDKAISSAISFEVINDKEFISKDKFEEKIINTLKDTNIELIVLAGWMKILSSKFVNSFYKKIINIHPSLLPSFKGTNAIQKALINKSCITGCSVHYVDPEVDSGELLVQAALPIEKYETEEILSSKIHKLEHIILPIAISEVGSIIRNDVRGKN